jgi:tungstate transport system substrate-binding protein
MSQRISRLLALFAALLLAAPAVADEAILATTTSVRDTGLLDVLLPEFEARGGAKLKVVAVGSGAALRMGADGNADVLVTHAPEGEQALVAAKKVLSREPIMENHFVIAGPPEDPAGVAKAATAVDAMKRIAAAKAPFASRGDDSGTHQREVALMRAAGLDPAARWPGFVSTGSGMGQTLQVAGEKRAYVLTDIGTFLAFRERVNLAALSKPDESLRNVYSVLVVTPAGNGFAAFLLEPATQRTIAEFGVKQFGQPLFHALRLPGAAGGH